MSAIVYSIIILCLISLCYLLLNIGNNQNAGDNVGIDVIDNYNKQINILENNLSEITLKLESIKASSESNNLYTESVLDNIKKDIEKNIQEILEDFGKYVSKDIYDKEVERINIILNQFNSESEDMQTAVNNYKTAVEKNINKLSELESKWVKMETDINLSLDNKIKLGREEILNNISISLSDKLNKTETTEIVQSVLNSVYESLNKIEDKVNNIKEDKVNNIVEDKVNNIKVEDIKQEIFNTVNKSLETKVEIDKINILTQNINNSIERNKKEYEEYVINLNTKINEKPSRVEIENAKIDLTKYIDNFISLNNTKLKTIENSLTESITSNASLFLEIKLLLEKVKNTIGDIDNLKYTPMLKGNMIDAIYDINTRLQKYEGNSGDIINMKKSIEYILKYVNATPSGFWDYYLVMQSVGFTMQNIGKKVSTGINVMHLDKYNSIKSKFNNAYLNVNNGGKALIYLDISRAVNDLDSLIDIVFVNPSGEDYNIKLSMKKEIQNAKKELDKISNSVAIVDYINNLQLSVNTLHNNRLISEEDVNNLKNQLENLTISTSSTDNTIINSLDKLEKSVNALAISNNEMEELKNVIKRLQESALNSYYMGNTVKSMENSVNNLVNWVGDWYTYGKGTNMKLYIQGIDEKIQKNKEEQDNNLNSLNKLKKLIGEYTLADDTSIGDIAMNARNEVNKVKSIIGSYNWNDWDKKSISESMSLLASKIIQIESALNTLNPKNVTDKINIISSSLDTVNNTLLELKSKDIDLNNLIRLNEQRYGEIYKMSLDIITKTIGMPTYSKSVYSIITEIQEEIKNINIKHIDYDKYFDKISKLELSNNKNNSYINNVNDYIKTVESKMNISNETINNLSKDLVTVKDTLLKNSEEILNYSVVKNQVNALMEISNKINIDLEWRSIIHHLEKINQFKFYIKNFTPKDKYAIVENTIQSIINSIKIVSAEQYSRTNEKFYSEFSTFNKILIDLYNNYLSKITIENVGNSNKELYDLMWKDCFSSVYAYINIVEYGNTRDTRWNEPLWHYTQRKFEEITTKISNLVSKDELKITNNNILDINTKLNTSIENIITFTDKFKDVDNNFITVNDKIKALEIKTGQATATDIPGIINVIDATSPDIDIPAQTGLNTSSNQYLFSAFNVVKGVVANWTMAPHVLDPSQMGYNPMNPHIYTKFTDLYNIILNTPETSVGLINNTFTIYSKDGWVNYPKNNKNLRSTDLDWFLNNIIANKTYTYFPDSPYSSVNPFSSTDGKVSIIKIDGKYLSARLTTTGTPYKDISGVLRKKEILNIINSIIEYSSKYGNTISFAFGVTITGQNTNLSNGYKLKGYSAKIYLDTQKSIINNTSTIVSDNLMDFSKQGFILNGKPELNITKYPSAVYNSRTNDTYAMCPNNSYTCGVRSSNTGTTQGNTINVSPVCCPFKIEY